MVDGANLYPTAIEDRTENELTAFGQWIVIGM